MSRSHDSGEVKWPRHGFFACAAAAAQNDREGAPRHGFFACAAAAAQNDRGRVASRRTMTKGSVRWAIGTTIMQQWRVERGRSPLRPLVRCTSRWSGFYSSGGSSMTSSSSSSSSSTIFSSTAGGSGGRSRESKSPASSEISGRTGSGGNSGASSASLK